MKTDINIENYTSKSFVLLGNTKKYKEDIKRLGGKFNCNLRDDKVGWVFPIEKKEEVQKWVNSDCKIPEKKDNLEQTLKQIIDNQKKFLKNQEQIMKKQEQIMKIINKDESSEDESSEDEKPLRLLKRI
jgi:hypothetical protein